MNAAMDQSGKERIKALFIGAADRGADAIAELLASSATGNLLGKTEFFLKTLYFLRPLGASVVSFFFDP